MKTSYFGFCSLAVSTMVLALSVPAQAQTVANYICDDDQTFEVTYDGNEAQLVLDDQDPITLTSVVAASGARYSDGTTTLYTQGQEAFVEVDGDRTYNNCLSDTTFTADTDDASVEESVVIEDESMMEETMVEDSSVEEDVVVESSTTVETIETVETVETVQEPVVQTTPAPAPTPAPAATPTPASQPIRALW
jgi:membrane-bound inhibitor of C-type lysozyme